MNVRLLNLNRNLTLNLSGRDEGIKSKSKIMIKRGEAGEPS